MNTAPAKGAGSSAGAAHAPPSERGPNCFKCQHFAISWQPHAPYACRLLGFKSRVLPAIEVMRIDGRKCLGFVAKPVPASEKKSIQLFA